MVQLVCTYLYGAALSRELRAVIENEANEIKVLLTLELRLKSERWLIKISAQSVTQRARERAVARRAPTLNENTSVEFLRSRLSLKGRRSRLNELIHYFG